MTKVLVTPGDIEFRKNTHGPLSTSVTVGTADVPLEFAGNETTMLAKGFQLSVGTFATITGDFGFSQFADGAGTDTVIAANNVDLTLAAGGTYWAGGRAGVRVRSWGPPLVQIW